MCVYGGRRGRLCAIMQRRVAAVLSAFSLLMSVQKASTDEESGRKHCYHIWWWGMGLNGRRWACG